MSRREAALREELRAAQAEIDTAYWRFTRCARAVPPSTAVPDAYRRRNEAREKLGALRRQKGSVRMAKAKKPEEKKRGPGQPPRAGVASRGRSFKATDAEWGTWGLAAERAGLSRSEWIRRRLDQAAERELK